MTVERVAITACLSQQGEKKFRPTVSIPALPALIKQILRRQPRFGPNQSGFSNGGFITWISKITKNFDTPKGKNWVVLSPKTDNKYLKLIQIWLSKLWSYKNLPAIPVNERPPAGPCLVSHDSVTHPTIIKAHYCLETENSHGKKMCTQ